MIKSSTNHHLSPRPHTAAQVKPSPSFVEATGHGFYAKSKPAHHKACHDTLRKTNIAVQK